MALISSLPLGTLIRLYEGGAAANYEIADINHAYSGGVVLVRKDLKTQMAFGSNYTYSGSSLDSYCNSTVFNTFPAEFQAICMNVNVPVNSGAVTRRCFAPTSGQLGGGANDGTAFSLYNSNAKRIKKYNGSAANWWSASQYYSSVVWLVYTDGSFVNNNPSYTYGVAPACVVLSSTQVEDIVNADGSYNIQYITTTTIDVKSKLGEYTEPPAAVRPILSYVGELDTLEACNNMNDPNPTWEPVQENQAHEFTNTTKTASKWAVGLHTVIKREALDPALLYEPVVLVGVPGGGGNDVEKFTYTYTGIAEDNTDNGVRTIKFTTSGTLTVLSGKTSVIAAIVGGGGGAAYASRSSSNAISAPGGNGGNQTQVVRLAAGEYEIVIGVGGEGVTTTGSPYTATGDAGGDTVAFGYTSTGGTGGDARAGLTSTTSESIPGTDGTPNGGLANNAGIVSGDTAGNGGDGWAAISWGV